jgi:hypothetical protein
VGYDDPSAFVAEMVGRVFDEIAGSESDDVDAAGRLLAEEEVEEVDAAGRVFEVPEDLPVDEEEPDPEEALAFALDEPVSVESSVPVPVAVLVPDVAEAFPVV